MSKYCHYCKKTRSVQEFRGSRGRCIYCKSELEKMRREGKLKKEQTIESIQYEVCKYFNVPVEMMQSNTRKREIVQARQIAMFFSKKLTKLSLESIGHQIGNKDHSTCIWSLKQVQNFIDTDEKYASHIDNIDKILKK